MPLERVQVETWLESYGLAWIEQDVSRFVGLFTVDAEYVETPFDPPMRGRQEIAQYWSNGAVKAQRDISFSHDVWAVSGMCAIAHWTASFIRKETGQHIELDGVFRLEFELTSNGAILCIRLAEWWHRREFVEENWI